MTEMTNATALDYFYSAVDQLDEQDARALLNALQIEIAHHGTDPFYLDRFETMFHACVPSMMAKLDSIRNILTELPQEDLTSCIKAAFLRYITRRPVLSPRFLKAAKNSIIDRVMEGWGEMADNFSLNDVHQYLDDMDLPQLAGFVMDTADATWRATLSKLFTDTTLPIWEQFDPEVKYVHFTYPDCVDLDYLIPHPVAQILRLFSLVVPLYTSAFVAEATPVADLGVLKRFFPVMCDALGTQWTRYGNLGRYLSVQIRQKYKAQQIEAFDWLNRFIGWAREKYNDYDQLSSEIDVIFMAYENNLQ